jgi:hypothetical protein
MATELFALEVAALLPLWIIHMTVFFNYCFEDLSHIQSFLIGEFNVSSMHVEAMSKELSAAQKRISAAASKGGFVAADAVASSELSFAAQRRIAIASEIRSSAGCGGVDREDDW